MRYIHTLAILLILCGCTSFKGRPSLELTFATTFQQQPDKSVRHTSKLEKNWWKHTDDETLKAAIRTLQQRNFSLEQAQLRLNAARLNSKRYSYLPSLSTTGSAQFNRLVKGDTAVGNVNQSSSSERTTGYYSASLDASWEMPIYGQLGDAANITQANIAFAEADIEAVRSSIISEAIRLYTDMRRLQQEIIQREIIVKSARKVVEYQIKKHKAGLITYSDLGESSRELLSAQSELMLSQSEKVASMQQLSGLLGTMKPDDAWQTPADIPSFDLPEFSDTPLDVLRNRPDIRRAESSVMTAAGEFYLSKSAMYPQLTLGGSLSQLGNITGNPLPGNTVQLTGIPSISLPLFDWSQRLATAHIRDEQLSEQASIYRETVIGAVNEVEEFWSFYRTAQATEKSTAEYAQIAKSAEEHARLLFRQGINDGIAAENAIINAGKAVIAEYQARSNTITRLTTLTKALGGVSTPIISEKDHD
ncbi:MAG: TolC family protein [Pseudomonadales bacterium]|nr:TolC family protein [Pseudomonadales bacterium]